MAGPLQGLKVIEMAGIGPGPFCAMLLADMGAEVLRIARPGARHNPHDVLARGRSVLALDLRAEGAAAEVMDAIASADVLIEGFRPGVMERLGLGPEVCLARNPRLVYGRMTGWGQHGPLAHAAGHDSNYTGLAGALCVIKTITVCFTGSIQKMVPAVPSHPYSPRLAPVLPGSSRTLTLARPQPMAPPRAARTSGGSPFAVMRSTVSGFSTRTPPRAPRSSSIWLNRR